MSNGEHSLFHPRFGKAGCAVTRNRKLGLTPPSKVRSHRAKNSKAKNQGQCNLAVAALPPIQIWKNFCPDRTATDRHHWPQSGRINSLRRDGELVSEPQNFCIRKNYRIVEHAWEEHNGKPA
jgi:hypothetical protein